MKRIKYGIYPGAFKPFHKGHYALLSQAIEENDFVFLLISLKDRVKKNEFPIYGHTMAYIWQTYIIPTFPEKVNPLFYNESVIKKTYSFLEQMEESKNSGKFTVYGAEDVVERFSDLNASFPALAEKNALSVSQSVRHDDISATKIRNAIKEDNYDYFEKYIYPNKHAEKIYKILKTNTIPNKESA